jgi:DNA-directed RNA polymerase specialized sigma24 family protein
MDIPSREEQVALDRELAQNYLDHPEEHRDAFAGRCTELLRRYVRSQIWGGGWCPQSTSPDTFAEDVSNRALDKLQKALCQLESSQSVHGWLRTIARTSIVDEIYCRTGRRKGGSVPRLVSIDHLTEEAASNDREPKLLREVESMGAATRSLHHADPEQHAIASEENTMMLEIFRQHSAQSNEGLECGTMIALKLREDLSIRELAVMLGSPRSTIHDTIAGNMAAYRKIFKKMTAVKPRELKR